MMMLAFDVILLIILLAIIQSLFGVGLLLFGTPLLLLMDYNFQETLFLLLPASMAISYSQVYQFRKVELDYSYRVRFFKMVLPSVALGIGLVSLFDLQMLTKWCVFLMLLVSFILRSYKPIARKLTPFISKNIHSSLFSMGLIHGISNMGGALLVPIASSLYKSPKKILTAISFDYAFMASLQFLILILWHSSLYHPSYLLTPLIALMTKLILNQKFKGFRSDHAYQKLINMLILCNSIVLFISLMR